MKAVSKRRSEGGSSAGSPHLTGIWQLSERLRCIADFVSEGLVVADVGTDHALLPIVLCLEERIPGAVAVDVHKGPLQTAAEHVREAGLEDRIMLRLSDGLKEVKEGEAESLVIAGMGGKLIVSILSDSRDKLPAFREMILSPHSDAAEVRRALSAEGFVIVREAFIEEDGKFYPVIKTIPSSEKERGKPVVPDEAEAAFGPCLLREKDPVLARWLQKKQSRDREILESLSENGSVSAVKRREELEAEASLIAEALERMKRV
ncbi:MAG: SAM-dependent methyltransferase [Eubacterium sp.]|nr:SAM-dependent methyltransferase [Eubacterium sp.]